MALEGGNERISFSKLTIHADNVIAHFGTGNDMQIYHNGTSSYVRNYTGNLEIVADGTDADIIFRTDDGSGGLAEYLRLDGGNTNMVASKTIIYSDNVKASFGAGEDLRILHNGTDSFITNYTNDLYITNTADDKDIIFRSDDGSGSYTTYFLLDGSTAKTQFNRHLKIIDNMQIQVGTNPDMLLYHDGSHSYIDNSTGDLRIRGAYVKLQGLNGENMLVGNQNGAVELYHDNSKSLKPPQQVLKLQVHLL